MVLTGTFTRSIDEKLRIAIPKRLRDATDCQKGGVFYVAPGTDGSLSLYTERAFETLAQRFANVSPTQQHVRAFTRLFYAQAQRVELDSQGRIRISNELAKMSQLKKDAVLLGVQDHVELWSLERWNEYLQEKQPHYDEIAEAALRC